MAGAFAHRAIEAPKSKNNHCPKAKRKIEANNPKKDESTLAKKRGRTLQCASVPGCQGKAEARRPSKCSAQKNCSTSWANAYKDTVRVAYVPAFLKARLFVMANYGHPIAQIQIEISVDRDATAKGANDKAKRGVAGL